MATEKEIGVVMARLAAAYPLLTIPPETMRLYKEELADMPAAALMDAAKEHICRGGKFFPTIYELRQAYEAERKRHKQELADREWKRQLEGWKEERLLESGRGAEVVAMDRRRG